MTQAGRRRFLIQFLLEEEPRLRGMEIPQEEPQQRRLLRSLMNLRAPGELPEEAEKVQDEYLQAELTGKGITDAAELVPLRGDLCLWQGDITTLRCDAIVNAANSGLTGCWYPCHNCIDNCIHTFAGMQLRLTCARLMEEQGYEEPAGRAKITPGYNLPCRWVLHTVGPIIRGPLTRTDEELLASCYRSCLNLALEKGLESVAFCCISTGEFHFPNRRAAEIAVETVEAWLRETGSGMRIIFNVFKDVDLQIYRELLAGG